MKAVPTYPFPPDVPIRVDPEGLSGAPCFTGTRVQVDSLFNNLGSGLNLDEYLDCLPDVTREHAIAVLEIRPQDGASGRMKVLPDAYVPRPLRKFLPDHLSLHDYKFWPHSR